jgi:hypothetical protein
LLIEAWPELPLKLSILTFLFNFENATSYSGIQPVGWPLLRQASVKSLRPPNKTVIFAIEIVS